MAITLGTALRYIRHALGDANPSAELSAAAIANQAGSWLYDAYDWRFKMRPPTTASIVADQTWIALPSDFGEMVGAPYTTSYWVKMATMADIAQFRRISGTVTGAGFYAAIAYTAVSSTTPPTPRLEIWPAQSASSVNGLTVPYKATWPIVTDDDTTLSIPPYAEALYLSVARAFARGYEDEEQGSLDQRLAHIQGGPVWRACEMRDGGEQSDYGQGDPGPAAEDGGIPQIQYVPMTSA